MTEPADHVGTSGRPHPLTRCRPDFCGQNPPSGTWGALVLPSGINDYTAQQHPDPAPVDDLSRFVLERIRHAEGEPHIDGLGRDYDRTGYAMAHRYAGHVRADMVVFRRIVAAYCACSVDQKVSSAAIAAYRVAVKELANRWSDHPDFRQEWSI